jgi:ADP-ribose pyrophosphatase YjhB (NUDIX family)
VKYCSACGNSIEIRIPSGDDRERYVCVDCETIHYVNPRVIVGCLPVYGEQVLLCRRAIEPRSGLWTLPAGFMENGETTEQGAARETWEEARARVRNLSLYRVYDVPHISQVYLFYLCELVDGAYGVGPESTETALFTENEIPWNEIAFPVVERTLRDYLRDRRQGIYPVDVQVIERRRPATGTTP